MICLFKISRAIHIILHNTIDSSGSTHCTCQSKIILFLVQSLTLLFIYPIGSMYGIFTYTHHKTCMVYLLTFTIKHQPNVGKYTVPYMDPMGTYVFPGFVIFFLFPKRTRSMGTAWPYIYILYTYEFFH